MTKHSAITIASIFTLAANIVIAAEDPASVKKDVADFKSNYQTVKYCFEEGPAYPNLD